MATEQWKKQNQDAMRKYRREWYYRNSEHAIEKVKNRRKMLREWFLTLKKKLKCEQCGQRHPATIAFHHNDPEQKEISLANACSCGFSKDQILKEIDKCTVLCHNCHSILHWEEQQKSGV